MTYLKPWHEEEDFWETWKSVLFPKERWEQTPEEVQNIIKILEIKDNAQILDLCCSPGRHALEFTRQGFQVTGVDRTKLYLEEAKNKATLEKLEIEFIQEDMRNFRREKYFDVVLSLFTSFGYF